MSAADNDGALELDSQIAHRVVAALELDLQVLANRIRELLVTVDGLPRLARAIGLAEVVKMVAIVRPLVHDATVSIRQATEAAAAGEML